MRGEVGRAHRDTNSFWPDGTDYRFAFGNWNRQVSRLKVANCLQKGVELRSTDKPKAAVPTTS